MYKFGEIEIESKKFNSIYEVQRDIDLERIRVSESIVANKHDDRFIVGYEVNPGRIVPLYIKTPRDCLSSGVSRFNEASPWKMGFNVSGDEVFENQYKGIWWRICEILHAPGCGGFQLGGSLTGEPLSNGKYVNAKLITWDNEIRTRFRGNYPGFIEDIGACHATGVLKIGSVYRQGSNYHLQVFLKECKYRKRDVSFESQLSDDGDSDESGVH